MFKVKIFYLLIVSQIFCISAISQEKIKIRVNDSTFFEHEVIIVKNDTVNGKVKAVYASDTSITAYEKSYYNGYQTGFYKIYFPTGKLMESYVYQKNQKNGEYTRYAIDGTVLVKGEYSNDVKDGYWAYRTYKLYGKFKNGAKNGKWKWYATEGKYFVYKFEKDNLLSVSPKIGAPEFPEYILSK